MQYIHTHQVLIEKYYFAGEENWVTVEKDKSGECHEMEPAPHNNHVSQPMSIRTSNSNPELGKPKQDKNKCKMSWYMFCEYNCELCTSMPIPRWMQSTVYNKTNVNTLESKYTNISVEFFII